jgi:hypothetical protein
MSLIDLILNLAALLLWLNWRAIDFGAISSPRVSIVSNLKKLNRSPSRWIFLGILIALLVVRAIIYWQLGSALNWIATIPLGPVTLSFRSDYWWRIFTYSFLSFGLVLGIFYLGLLFFSIVNTRISDADPLQKLVRLHVGWLEHLPWFVRLLLPFAITLTAWVCLRPLFLGLNLIPQTSTFRQTIEQGAIIGLNAYFVWKFYLLALLFLYVLNSYIYFGRAPIWNYIAQTGRRLMAPLQWLRIGRLDFAPLLAMAVVFFGARFAEWGLGILFRKLTA